jgi:hypothetical protein
MDDSKYRISRLTDPVKIPYERLQPKFVLQFLVILVPNNAQFA